MLNGSTAIEGFWPDPSRVWPPVAAAGVAGLHAKNPDRPFDVLQMLLAGILEGDVQPVADMFAGGCRDADAARLGDVLQPRRHIDAVAKDVAVLDDDVAEIDADAELDAPILGTPALRPAIPCWISTAQATAFTTLVNSTSMPSPVSLTMRPLCSAILASTSSLRLALNAASVAASSTPISLE